MKSRLVQIGNSRGVRLGKPLLELAALSDEVEIEAEPGVITIRSALAPRAGWAEAVAQNVAEPMLDPPTTTAFDTDEWAW